ncbi:sulfotransferase family 2 domain-containing protein [Metabacillus halosaccharovorans]|uniref:sulfotransferase family 2 domain-containing protein n=1 Tax=Metabacillus halosaccharovorans TaxID=930124 RepID=UPI00203C3D03|nr:sulfotransferase family 2 domain-containing protein [Metabacillus halosaccharovorans]MCM3443750.1 sulfotransferase family 2 domain-containing protein [Metabacillus halosaccharovorans]
MIELEVRNNQIFSIDKSNNSYEKIISFGAEHNNFTNISSNKLLNKFVEIINLYQMIQKYTNSEMSLLDIVRITSLVFKKLMSGNYENIKALEIGNMLGCSSYFLVSSLTSFSNENYLYCMNDWEQTDIQRNEKLYDHFKSVMKLGEVNERIIPIVSEPTKGMKVLKNNFFDIIYFDSGHSYENVFNELINIIDKIKVGGLLIGYNSECFLEHLDEVFGNSYSKFDNSLIWYKVITKEDKEKIKELYIGSKEYSKELIALLEDLYEAISDLQLKIFKVDKKVFHILLDYIINLISKIEDTIISLWNEIGDREIKLLANNLKRALIDFKISYDEEDLIILETIFNNQIQKYFNQWIKLMNNEFIMDKVSINSISKINLTIPDESKKIVNLDINKNSYRSDILLENKVIFIHIPKVAGNGLLKSLGIETPGHIHLYSYELRNPETFEEFFKIGFVRNPWDRIVSAFFYLKNGGSGNKYDLRMQEKLQKFDDFGSFILEVVENINFKNWLMKQYHFKPQFSWMMNSIGEIEMDYIGRFENLDEGFDILKNRLNKPESRLEKINSSKHKPFWEYYNEEF